MTRSARDSERDVLPVPAVERAEETRSASCWMFLFLEETIRSPDRSLELKKKRTTEHDRRGSCRTETRMFWYEERGKDVVGKGQSNGLWGEEVKARSTKAVTRSGANPPTIPVVLAGNKGPGRGGMSVVWHG